jgi:hypothetical protein
MLSPKIGLMNGNAPGVLFCGGVAQAEQAGKSRK